jgi:hypothetical protein
MQPPPSLCVCICIYMYTHTIYTYIHTYMVFIVQAYQTSQYVVPRGGIFLGKWRSYFAGSSGGKMNVQSACALNTRYYTYLPTYIHTDIHTYMCTHITSQFFISEPLAFLHAVIILICRRILLIITFFLMKSTPTSEIKRDGFPKYARIDLRVQRPPVCECCGGRRATG